MFSYQFVQEYTTDYNRSFMMSDHDADPKTKSIDDPESDSTEMKTNQQQKQVSVVATTEEEKKEAIFHARPSGRVATSITTDHDKWVEHLAVVDMLIPNCYTKTGEPKYELQIRSFFVSTKTGKKIWDEPPSGAEVIEYANEEIMRMAEAQKRDLECVSVQNGNGKKKEKKKLGARVMSRLRRGSFKRKNKVSKNDVNSNAVQLKKNSRISEILQESSREFYDNSNEPDANLQMALAKSASEECNEIHTQRERREEEQLAVAMAMSLSVKGD